MNQIYLFWGGFILGFAFKWVLAIKKESRLKEEVYRAEIEARTRYLKKLEEINEKTPIDTVDHLNNLLRAFGHEDT